MTVMTIMAVSHYSLFRIIVVTMIKLPLFIPYCRCFKVVLIIVTIIIFKPLSKKASVFHLHWSGCNTLGTCLYCLLCF